MLKCDQSILCDRRNRWESFKWQGKQEINQTNHHSPSFLTSTAWSVKLLQCAIHEVLELSARVELEVNILFRQPIRKGVSQILWLVSFTLNFINSTPIIDGFINFQCEAFPLADLANIFEPTQAFQV
jgi:hypothetical protein